MEDEDVDSVNKHNDPAIEKSMIDGPITFNDTRDVVSPDNHGESVSDKEYETDKLNIDSIDKSIDRLKNFFVNNENTELDKCKVNEDSSIEPTSPSLKKVNGEVDKSGSVTSSEEEPFENEKTSDNENVVEESKSSEDVGKETISDVSGGSNKRKHSSSDRSELADSENESDIESVDSSQNEFRGFKKRKTLVSDSEKIVDGPEVNSEIESSNETDNPKSIELRRSARNVSSGRQNSEAIITVDAKEESGDQLTEYAQYLGLQPTVKFKCGRCGEKHFQTMASLNAHQMICCKPGSNALIKQAKPSNDLNPSTNFRITRKVYLCSACGTYYENWKLFLHMRDMHKRHICLFCLGMFSVAERLAEHLLYQHNVHEKTCKSPEEFLNLFKGSCFLTCCSCEKMFTERDDFYDHQCKDSIVNVPNWNNEPTVLTAKDIKELAQKCTLCGVKCGHFRTCPKVSHKFQQNTPSSSVTSSTNTPNNNPSNINLDKYFVPVPTNVQKTWTPDNANPEILKQALSLSQSEKDYYDVGSAASFCHVDIVNDSDSVSSPEKAVVDKTNLGRKKFPKYAHKSATPSQDVPESNTDEKSDDDRSSCKSFTNTSNNIKNSFSDNDYSDSRHDSNDDRISDEPTQKCSVEEDSVKSVVDDDPDDRMSIDDDRVSTGGNVDVRLTPKEDTISRLEDKPDPNENKVQENPETQEETTDTGGNNETSDSKPDSEDVTSPSQVGLNKLDENEIVDSSNECKNEDPVVLNCNISSTSSDTNSSSRSDVDTDHENAHESSKTDEVEERPKDDKTETTFETEEPSKVEVNELSSNEAKLSPLKNEERCDNRFENNIDNDRESENDESEDSDKLSVDLSEEDNDNAEIPDNNDVDTNDVPTDNDSVKQDDLDDHSETDVTPEQLNENSKNDSSLENNSENDITMEESQPIPPPKDKIFQCDGVNVQLASEEVMSMALTLEDKMDSLSSQSLIKECVRTSCTTCSYCSHAIKIAVNGKQLAIHLLTEHRYMPVKNETIDDIIERLKNSLDELQDVWFNTDSYDSSDKSCFVNYDRTYECFQCNYVANTHKDLFSHKRKVHQKTILYCNMCKENFYSYSELLCHMCPGLYDAAKDIQFRCCLCTSDRIPSAFRLMVHLRKSHHACDICLEIIDDQQKLSTHMVKHKLHHLCYRCGIAYRNKPDITKHLFWKHGTESVLCKKCLQKKWPHVYHFCIPPNLFICEECNLSFSKAVYLKVHKRFHNNNLPYPCSLCEQKFVSKKLLSKHGKIHEPVTAEIDLNNDTSMVKPADNDKNLEQNKIESNDTSIHQESAGTVQCTGTPDKSDEPLTKPHKKKSKRERERKVTPVVDVYDLPPLNLSSESDDTDDEKENSSAPEKTVDKEKECSPISKPEGDFETSTVDDARVDNAESGAKPAELNPPENEETAQPVTVVDGIWDSFHSYKAEQEKRENLDIAKKQTILSQLDPTLPPIVTKESVLGDHDYCLPNNEGEPGQLDEADSSVVDKNKSNEHSSSIDHDYCTQKNDTVENNNVNTSLGVLNSSNQSDNAETSSKRKQKSPKKKSVKQNHNSSSSSDSSTDSDSSSCSCGTNCSCSSSSSNSSSSSSSDSDSSSSDGRNNSSNLTASSKRERKKERLKNKRKNDLAKPAAPLPSVQEPIVNIPIEPEEPLIRESELDTDETVTDEEFYDQYPQMRANQILAEKRNQLMVLAAVAPTINNGSSSPPVPNSIDNTNINLDPVSSPKLEIVTPPVTPLVQPQAQSKKKVKSKKRRKSSLGKSRSSNKQQNLVNDVPQPSTSFSLQWSSHGKKTGNDISPMYTQSPVQPTTAPVTGVDSSENMLSTPVSGRQQSQFYGASSESNSSKRFSKRRRVRNKFYGYSSDEDGEHNQLQPPVKWKKFSSVEGNVKQNSVHQQPQPQQYSQSFQPQVNPNIRPEYNHTYQQPTPALPPLKLVPPTTIRTTFSENQVSDGLIVKKAVLPSSESSSDSEADSDDSDSNRLTINQKMNPAGVLAGGLNVGTSEKDDKLYCYCQCPYDEVSEMIACDGIDCAIEWFHFECVGIMVPPKGKWYCPDCRKRRGLS